MQGNRTLAPKLKARIILDKRFPLDVEVGDAGQLLLDGTIEAERIELIDDVDIIIKTIRILKVEKIDKNGKRNI